MVAMLLLAAIMAAQVPTFSARVDMVGLTLTAVATDTGLPVSDLQASDVVIVEDGVPRPIAHFERENVPASVLVLIDASSSVDRLESHIRLAATRLIRSLRQADEVQVVQFASRYQELSEFSMDHEQAIAALTRGFVRDDDTYLTRSLWTAAAALERRYPGELERRRIIILLSDGENTSGSFTPASAIERLQRGGVTCYVVHIARKIVTENDRVADARDFMIQLARESGGRIVTVPFYEPFLMTKAFDDIAQELGTQYHLAFESAASTPGWHTIGVASRSRIGLSLRYRRSFYVPLRR